MRLERGSPACTMPAPAFAAPAPALLALIGRAGRERRERVEASHPPRLAREERVAHDGARPLPARAARGEDSEGVDQVPACLPADLLLPHAGEACALTLLRY